MNIGRILARGFSLTGRRPALDGKAKWLPVYTPPLDK